MKWNMQTLMELNGIYVCPYFKISPIYEFEYKSSAMIFF